jgi:hypothetical protein
MTLKLSEAIRLGAMLRPQDFGQYHSPLGTCALGAAEDAGFDFAVLRIPNMWRTCPGCGVQADTVRYLIVHMNDRHRWTREQIAAWVEQTVEQADVATTQGETV